MKIQASLIGLFGFALIALASCDKEPSARRVETAKETVIVSPSPVISVSASPSPSASPVLVTPKPAASPKASAAVPSGA